MSRVFATVGTVAVTAGAMLAFTPAANADYAKCKWHIEWALTANSSARDEAQGASGSRTRIQSYARHSEEEITEAVTQCVNQPVAVTSNVANALTKTTNAIAIASSSNGPPARHRFGIAMYGASDVLHAALTALPKPKGRRTLLKL